MSPPGLTLRCVKFTRDALAHEVARACEAAQAAELTQVRYLASYLANSEAATKTIVAEAPYVDRHYLEEYTRYYATSLRGAKPHTTRLHFFRRDLTDQQLDEMLVAAASGSYDTVCADLQSHYLGFVVVRPLPSAPIGRTILATYNHGERRRHYAIPAAPYDVHLAGLRLTVRGLPFQQQEQAVGACATTALWSALARVMRTDGNRAPTPFAVTEAANKHVVSDRVMPAVSGLARSQILEAIRQFGYAPLYLEPRIGSHELFRLIVKCYVRSGIPVVLQLYVDESREGHAVAVVGYRESDDHEPAASIEHPQTESISIRGRGMSRLYVHDDRLGAYARAVWTTTPGDELAITFKPGEPGYAAFEQPVSVTAAMVPHYPKIRLSAQDLIGFAGQLLPLMRQIVGPARRDEIIVEPYFALSGDYLRDILMAKHAAPHAARLASSVMLPRYVGVIRYWVGDQPLADAVCDSTDIRRDIPSAAPLLAIVPKFSDAQILEDLRKYAHSEGGGAFVP